MPRDYYDPESRDDDLFEADELRRRQAKRAAVKESLELAKVAEAKQTAALKARMDERAQETNRRQVIAEYQAAGVEPPSVDGNGKPTTSLSLLLRMGWKIENISGRPTLLRPAWMPPPSRPAPEPEFGAPVRDEEEIQFGREEGDVGH